MNSSLQTRAVAEGALMAALTALLALAGIYIPFLSLITNLVWTIPIITVTVRHGLLLGVMSMTVAGLLILMMSSPALALVLVLQFGGLALVYGYSFHNRIKPGATLLMGMLTAVLSLVGASLFYFWATGINPLDIAASIKEGIEPSIEFYREMGLLKKNGALGFTEESFRLLLQAFVQFIRMIVPALIAIYGFASALIIYIISQKILEKLKLEIPRLTAFRYWQLPWWTIWGFIAGYGAYLVGSYLSNEILHIVGINIILVYMPVSFVLGSAVAAFYFHKYLKGGFLNRLIIFLSIIFFPQILMFTLAIIGLADLIFNYRRLPVEN